MREQRQLQALVDTGTPAGRRPMDTLHPPDAYAYGIIMWVRRNDADVLLLLLLLLLFSVCVAFFLVTHPSALSVGCVERWQQEVLTLRYPWDDVGSKEDLWRRVQLGERPEVSWAQEQAAPRAYMELMWDMWQQEAAKRPTFTAALGRLRALAEALR